MGSSRVNIGNAAPSRKKVKKPKKMRGGGSVGDPLKMKDGGGLQDMSGDGKITQRDRIMAARGEKPIKRAMGGVDKKSGVIKKTPGPG
jgi:hypothetical protein